jgi:hypothetical protein
LAGNAIAWPASWLTVRTVPPLLDNVVSACAWPDSSTGPLTVWSKEYRSVTVCGASGVTAVGFAANAAPAVANAAPTTAAAATYLMTRRVSPMPK